jgi:hypothetical protein
MGTDVVALPVHFVNDQPLLALEVTLRPNSSVIQVDSVSFLNSRLNVSNSLKGWDLDDLGRTMTVYFTAYLPNAVIPPGQGPLALLWVTRIDGLDDRATVYLDTASLDDGEKSVGTYFIEDTLHVFTPQFTRGVIHFEGPCCVGLRGNVDMDPDDYTDVSDILFLARAVLLGGAEPTCMDEANVAEIEADILDVSDVLYLARAALLGGDPPPPCP